MNDFVSIAIVNYNNKDYLQRCINSILNQSYKNFEIIFIDNCSVDGSFEYVSNLFKQENIKVIKPDTNLGYAGGANLGIDLSSGNYVMIMNPDVILDKDFVKECCNLMESDSEIAAINGKLLKYDFEKDVKLNIFDSTGICVERSRRAYDRGQNQEDVGQYEKTELIFGVCGAAAFYRKSALEDIKIEKEYFDEDFFAYKEDIDLSWRLNLYGYKNIYYPKALAYHGRALGGSRGGIKNYLNNRKSQSKFLRGISFRNHYLMLLKNETHKSFGTDKFKILKRFFVFLGYSLIFERFNFKYLVEIYKLKGKILHKKSLFMNNEKIKEINIDVFN
ncbi:glycosyltransferase family 2 protein [Clostridium grantii]|uniref:Glycosyltransferase, GT2 family n=1 Tax=Clostridium grantii DSM 8605 TaxID=1121316 RepID=A0A1M5RKN6_9CLOT|nr:glycosyltransferase family 2 protein [Clostridium grantii]SHH26815.1 Glycosyltransferase, GT2 family [Clostridium grantii DSM 8605]